jgi:hypothetical protein
VTKKDSGIEGPRKEQEIRDLEEEEGSINVKREGSASRAQKASADTPYLYSDDNDH